MKKFITTKLHTSVEEKHQKEEKAEEDGGDDDDDDDDKEEKENPSGIVGLKSPSSSSPPLSSVVAVTVMTLNSPASKHSSAIGAVPPASLQQQKQPKHHQQQQQQHGIITISKPKPPPTISSSTSTAAQVKMCGYLKKKRNKMGGWRKMYFILQNQLLLSYSSKDDYEKKLAPFKDIINLVPGTVIIPTTGPRFTIETNSKVLYTFRCDDHKSCSEWITALLDSLKGDAGSSDKKYSQSLHGNLQHNLTRRSLSSLSSSSSSTSSTASATTCYATDDPSKMAITSIRRLQQNLHPLTAAQQQASLSAPNLFYGFGSNGSGGGSGNAPGTNVVVKMGKLVQLPIAGGTARLLERGGVNGQQKYKILTINEVEDDGENDEKPTTAAATAVARGISNGSSSRGDPGIKVTTKASSTSSGNSVGKREDKGKNVQSRSAAAVAATAAAVTVNGSGAQQVVGSSGSGGSKGESAAAVAAAALLNNFRLHTNLEKMHQSIEVCRINSMFCGKKLTAAGRRLNHGGGSANSSFSDSNCSLAASTGDLRSTKGFGGASNNLHGNNNNSFINKRGIAGGSATDLRKQRPTATKMTMESKPLTDINHNNLAKWSAESITIELTANGFNLGGKSAGSTDTLYRKVPSGESSALRSCSRSNSHSSNLHQQCSSQQNHSSKTELNRSPPPPVEEQQNHQQQGRLLSKRHIYEEIAGGREPLLAADADDNSLASEPIYAVVDLSVKKARRLNQLNNGNGFRDHAAALLLVDDEEAGDTHHIKVDMVRDMETGRLKEKSKSTNLLLVGGGAILPAPVSNNDYEELSELAMEHFAEFGADPDDSNDGENIYEPINIPEAPLSSSSTSLPSPQPTASSSQMNNLWRNLKKMNINHLMKRSVQETPLPHPQQDHHQRDEEDPSAKASTFSELSKKFGHHRRSIKNRMRVLVDRRQPSPTAAVTSDVAPKMTQSDEKLRKNSDGRLFSSTFGRNKKSRKSLSFDDFIPRKKHHHHVNGVGVICRTDKANDKLHKELKRQLSKRSDSSSGGSSVQEHKNSIEL